MPWTRIAWQLAEQQNWLLTAAQALDAGLSRNEIHILLRSGRWRRVFRGVYLIHGDTMASELAPQILIRAGQLSIGPQAVAVLKAAAQLHGIVGWRSTEQALDFAVPPQAATPARVVDRGIVVHQWTLPLDSVTHIADIPVTTPLRTLSDLLLSSGRFDAVSTLDAALNRKLIDRGDVDRLIASFHRRRGAVLARQFVAEADGRAESPLETRGRLCLADAGLAPDEVQADIFDDEGIFLARADMLWRSSRLIAEADGAAFHQHPDALFRDRHRQNDLVRAGYRVVRFTWDDVIRPGYVAALIRSMLAA
jgi:predicted transcriptional regulator of viral defense system